MTRSLLALALFLAAVASSRAAFAQDDPAARARANFEEGVRLLDAQQYAAAADAFERSLALNDSPTARYNLALAYRGNHQVRQSIGALRLFLAEPTGTPQQMIEDAARVLGEQERLLVHVTLRVHGPAPAEVTVDGELTAPTASQSLELDPGHHVFTAHAVDRAPERVERDLAEGAHETVTVELETAADRRGHIDVAVTPATAEIAVDGQPRAHGTFAADLDAGVHSLRVAASGYVTRERRIALRTGDRVHIDLSLAPAGGGADGAAWVWLGVGITAVVAGTVIAVLAAVLTSTTYAPLDGGSTGVVAMALR